MITKKTWEEFRSCGLLWFVNTILHTFGWAICFDIQEGKLVDVFPARVKFRGFSEEAQSKGYINLSEYLKENIDELTEEAKS